MDKTELNDANPGKPEASSDKGGGSSDRRSFILGMAAGTVAAGALGAATTGMAEPRAGAVLPQTGCPDDPFVRFSKAVVREVPLTQIAGYLGRLGSLGPASFGNACGNGCGSGCGNNCLSAVDQAGYSELTLQQLNDIAADKNHLRTELKTQIQVIASSF